MPSFSSISSARSGSPSSSTSTWASSSSASASSSTFSKLAHAILLLSLTLSITNIQSANASEELILYNSLAQGLSASNGASLLIGRSLSNYCTNPDTPTSQYEGWEHDAILQFCVDPWMGGGLKLANPNVWAYGYVTFLARAEYDVRCMPKFSMTCGWWPRYGSNSIELSGEYVAGGQLVADEWRQVIIPTSDLLVGSVCEEKKDTYSGFYSVNFAKCNPPPKYWITDIRLTDEPPGFGTTGPTENPTVSPTTSPTPYSPTVVWDEIVADPDNSCLDARNNSTQIQSEFGDYLQLVTDPWKGASLQIKSFCFFPDIDKSANPTYNHFTDDDTALTFELKATGAFDHAEKECAPVVSMSGGSWIGGVGWSGQSAAIEITHDVVDYGVVSPTEYRQVSIPMTRFKAGTDWDLSIVHSISFHYCPYLGGAGQQPVYYVRNMQVTKRPPQLMTPFPTSAPTVDVTGDPSLAPSDGTQDPTKTPTISPTTSPTPYSATMVWDGFVDDPDNSCLDARNNSTQIQSELGDYFQLVTDPWMGATLQIERSCFFPDVDKSADPSYNHFTDDDLALTFELKATGDFDNSEKECDPAVSMAGGSWINSVGWSGQSAAVKITHNVIDYGVVSPTEYRQVSIPMTRFKAGTDWDLSRVYSISFHYCPDLGLHSHEQQPKYYVRNMQVTKRPPQMMTPYPTSAPTVRVTEDASLATHRMVHHHWYPVLGDGVNGDTSLWLEAVNDQWPSIPADAGDHEVTIHIPMGSVVTYSEASNVKLDKVVVHGTLIVQPVDANVVLTVGTLVVEMMGTLEVSTQQNGYSATIEIDGELDTLADPEQTMVGLVNLGGTVTISGDPISSKMAQLKSAIAAGDTTLVLDDPSGTAAASWSVGDELVLPDTKEGQDVDYWNFKVQVPGETETVVIGAMTIAGSELHITLLNPVEYEHTVGCHAAHITRSITITTSASSTDRGHVMHTGMGQFDVANARFVGLGRTTVDRLNNTVMEDTGIELPMGLARLQATHVGTNQIARYALHSHHSMVKVHWSGNVVMESPRNCMVMHNSFGDITENVAIGCNGTAIFLESGTESGVVENNFLIGTGGGTRGHDDGRFASGGGEDMAHGGFGIWTRGLLAPIQNNHAEGTFARSPYAFFVHPLFINDNAVPMVEGTNPAIAGKTLREIYHHKPVSLQTYGPFSGNSALGTWRSALDLSYFGPPGVGAGHIIEGFNFTALAYSGAGIFMVHSSAFDLVDGNFEASYPGNEIVGEFCNNGDPPVVVYNNNTVLDGFAVIRGGNC